jgi:hypothetical protein
MIRKVKLPRKRKKAYVKVLGRSEYRSMQITCEALYEDEPLRENAKFPSVSGLLLAAKLGEEAEASRLLRERKKRITRKVKMLVELKDHKERKNHTDEADNL